MDRQELEQVVKSHKLDAKMQCYMVHEELSRGEHYKDMDPRFLNDIEWLTGCTNGLAMTDRYIYLIIKAFDTCAPKPRVILPIASFSLVFDKDTGSFIGIEDIVYTAPVLNEDQRQWQLTSNEAINLSHQVVVCLKEFVKRANETVLFEHIRYVEDEPAGTKRYI